QQKTAYPCGTARGSFTTEYTTARQPAPSRSTAAVRESGPPRGDSGAGAGIVSPSSRAARPRWITASPRPAGVAETSRTTIAAGTPTRKPEATGPGGPSRPAIDLRTATTPTIPAGANR